MLPFHKRARANSIMEIGSEELEAVELPNVRPPSVRPGAFASVRPSSGPMFPQQQRRRFDSYADEEMTVVRMDKRVSTSPPPRVQLESPRIPKYSPPPRFDRDDEPTQAYVHGSRPLLSMQSQKAPRSVIVDQTHETPPPPVSSRLLPEAPRSAVAVDAASSAHVRAVDMSMTASLSGSTDISKLRRPTMGWGVALVAVGVFAGIITAFVARGEGLATAAAFIDPSHQAVTADVAKPSSNLGAAQPQQAQVEAAPAQLKPGAGTVVVQSKPAAPSCDANAVPAPKAEPKETAKVEAAVAVKIEKPVVAHYVAPVVHHVEAAPREAAPAVVAQAAPPPAITKPAVVKPAKHASSNDMESASAADALAKAQLEAALSR